MLGTIVGFLVWLVANLTYARLRRMGQGGAGRFFSFWLGLPTTVVLLITLQETVPWEETDFGIDSLLDEIREDREFRPAEPDAQLLKAPDSEPMGS